MSNMVDLQIELKQDGYGSGDLGDVSHAYATEVAGTEDTNEPDEVRKRSPVASGSGKKMSRRAKKKRHRSSPQMKREGGESAGLVCRTSEVVASDSGEICGKVVSPPSKELVQDILKNMWRYCHAYHIRNSVSVCVC